MKSRQPNQKGFATVETILVVIAIALVSFTVWFAWHSKQATNKILNDAKKSSQGTASIAAKTPTTFAECKAAAGSKILTTSPEQCVTKVGKTFTAKVDQTASWTQYIAPDSTYKMKIPDGWNIDQNSETRGNLQIMDNSLAIKPGVKGTYYVTPGYGKDYDYGFTIIFYSPERSGEAYANAVKGATKQNFLRTQTGLTIEKYYYLQTTDPGTPGLQKGGISYTYAIKDGKKLLLTYYSFAPSDMDYHANVETALKTIEIL